VATWILAGAVTFVSVVGFADLSGVVARFGLVPAEAWRSYGATFVSSFFLHGGVVHLLGNLYFLLVFGDDAEDRLGVSRLLVLVFTAAMAGAALHVLVDPRSEVPVIGASAGISGVLVFYALSFPRARLAIVGPFWRWIRLPAAAYLGLWLLIQGLGAWQQVTGPSSVSHVGHLGGAAAGAAWWLALRSRREAEARGGRSEPLPV
jgi:membrane associated rhomboid family serine protease